MVRMIVPSRSGAPNGLKGVRMRPMLVPAKRGAQSLDGVHERRIQARCAARATERNARPNRKGVRISDISARTVSPMADISEG